MFTGLIEERGTLLNFSEKYQLTIAAQTVLEGLSAGDSIAVNGVCLTVVSFTAQSFTADVMPETLRRSNLGMLRAKSQVNLERALPVNGRLGGHFVSGHIDGISLTVVSVDKDQFSVSVIPHTAAVTTLAAKRPGDKLNLETDLLGKYVLRALSLAGEDGTDKKSRINEEWLRKLGY